MKKLVLIFYFSLLGFFTFGQGVIVRDLPISRPKDVDQVGRDSIISLTNKILALEAYINGVLDGTPLLQQIQVPIAGYDSTYTLATTQKFAIPEDVTSGDYVGQWLKTWTWRSGNEIRYSLTTDFNGAFSINDSTGIISIADASKINGKVVQQDTVINLLVRSRDGELGYEIDTAVVRVKEATYCVFIDYFYSGTESGTRLQPYNGLLDATITAGYGYFIKRGTTGLDKSYSLSGIESTVSNPVIFGVYGVGEKPIFNGANLTTQDGLLVFLNTPVAWTNVQIYDLSVKNYPECSFRVNNGCTNVGLYNIYTNANVRLTEAANTGDIHFYNTGDTAISSKRNFEIINLESVNSLGPAVLSQAAGTNLVNIKSSTASLYTARGYNVRLQSTYCTIKHFVFTGGQRSLQLDYKGDWAIDGVITGAAEAGFFGLAASLTPQDNIMLNNILFRNNFDGIYNYSAGFDNWKITNNYFHKNTNRGVYLRNGGVNLLFARNKIIGNTLTGTTFEYATQGGSNSQILYNIWADNGTDVLGSDASNSTDMLFYNNMVKGTVNLSGTSGTMFRNNFYTTLTGSVTSNNNLSIGSINTSDYFIDYSNNNFILKVTATLARDNGYSVGVTPDHIGTVVPQNSVTDIGPYEYKN